MSFQHLNWWGSGWWRYQLNTNWWCQYYWQLENMGMQVAPSGSSDNVYHVNICISPSYLYIYLKQIPSLLLQWSVRPQCNMTQWKQVDISYKLHNKVKCVKNKLSDLRRCSNWINGIFCQHQFPLWSQLGSWAGCPSQIISRLNYIRANVSPSQSWDSDSNFKQIWTQKMNLKSFRLCFCLVYQYLFYILQKYLYIYNTSALLFANLYFFI